MFSYKIIETNRGPFAQILHGENVIDECGPWENLSACIAWADEYVQSKNSGIQEPYIP
jgi:hypothetical protein